MFELINPYVAKILVSAKDRDSIRQISKKIQESYGWTYRWVSELENIGAVRRKKQEVYINKKSSFYRAATKFIKESFSIAITFVSALASS